MEDLLFLTQRIPYPPIKGDKIRSWHILQHLARYYRVHLGCFIDDRHDQRFVSALTNVCASVHYESINPLFSKIRSLMAIPCGEPMTLRYFGSRSLQDWVDATCRRNNIRRAFIFSSAMAPYVAGLRGLRRVFDMVDVDSQKWLQYAHAARTGIRFLYAHESRSLLRFERKMARVFEHTLLVSPAELDLFLRLAPECVGRVLSVSNGVDPDYFSPNRIYPDPFDRPGTKLVFTGAMDYRPNVEAVQWFVDAVMPNLAEKLGDFEFWIVGANPVAAVRRLAERSRVRVTGRVDDVRPYLAHSAAVVAPLLTARGVQNKVLEAMAMAKPVVATPQAKEGISAVAGEELLVGGNAEELALKLQIALSGNGAAIGKRARRRVETDYVWSKSLESIRLLLEADRNAEAPLSATAGR